MTYNTQYLYAHKCTRLLRTCCFVIDTAHYLDMSVYMSLNIFLLLSIAMSLAITEARPLWPNAVVGVYPERFSDGLEGVRGRGGVVEGCIAVRFP